MLDSTGMNAVRFGPAPKIPAGVSTTPKVIIPVSTAPAGRPHADGAYIERINPLWLTMPTQTPWTVEYAFGKPVQQLLAKLVAPPATPPIVATSTPTPNEVISTIQSGNIVVQVDPKPKAKDTSDTMVFDTKTGSFSSKSKTSTINTVSFHR